MDVSSGFDISSECQAAARRIGPHVRYTPVEFSPVLSELSGARVHLKLENLQATGSFKLRGATNAVLSVEDRQKAVVTASSGNHGIAVARAASVCARCRTSFGWSSAAAASSMSTAAPP